jgi:hypothetical protein
MNARQRRGKELSLAARTASYGRFFLFYGQQDETPAELGEGPLGDPVSLQEHVWLLADPVDTVSNLSDRPLNGLCGRGQRGSGLPKVREHAKGFQLPQLGLLMCPGFFIHLASSTDVGM